MSLLCRPPQKLCRVWLAIHSRYYPIYYYPCTRLLAWFHGLPPYLDLATLHYVLIPNPVNCVLLNSATFFSWLAPLADPELSLGLLHPCCFLAVVLVCSSLHSSILSYAPVSHYSLTPPPLPEMSSCVCILSKNLLGFPPPLKCGLLGPALSPLPFRLFS